MNETRNPTRAVAFIRVSAIKLLLEQFDNRQEKARELLSRHGIMRPLLSDPYAVIPLQRFVAFFEDAATALDDPFFGAKLGAVFKPGDIGPVGMLFSLSPSIMDAFDRISKFANSLQNTTNSNIVMDGDTLVWSYRISDNSIWPRRQDAEYSLAASCQLVRSNFKASWKPLEVHFEHEMPAQPEVIRRIFRSPVLFKQSSNRIVMNREEAVQIYRNENKELSLILERHMSDLMSQTYVGQSLSSKVKSLIGLYIGRRHITVGLLAEELGLTPRTLQRRLGEEGATIRNLTLSCRQELARNLLSAENSTMSDIAQALGYADGAVFCRAFKSWAGHPPSKTEN
ncbi:AraC family transcriptional regulator [Phyllobacterium phragmitis]|uniref:AraC family transcriptional regulator n=1 Tax=Phyllobacterium phragmitis TaxID=2670329 RepID=A0A2S9ITA6_9HYPH|nr:AraC family transcriptional regulator [Phyllobacterium phragmitis]PRD43762.1 AraC family transcriptional regulator [Phyllobacterium phragmitis]